MHKQSIENLSMDWKTATNDAHEFISRKGKLMIVSAYALAALLLIGALALGGVVLIENQTKEKTYSEIKRYEKETENAASSLRFLKENAAQLKAINAWIETEFPMQPIAISLIDKVNSAKLDQLKISISEDRKSIKIEASAIGSTKGVNDSFSAIIGSLKKDGFEILSMDQPRIPGGSKLIARIQETPSKNGA
jgi:hypothetical protein